MQALVEIAMRPPESLSLFHPLIQEWFRSQIGTPTDVQQKTWPLVAEDRHVLISAPTGSGKTLAAFLWSLQQLLSGSWSLSSTRILYISPLKALNNDITRNLLRPLGQLKGVFEQAGEPFPEIHIHTRSGDTPQSERRAALRCPPEILITTPESLNILLTAKNSRVLLRGLATVILDEVHAVAGTKRGTHLMTAVDRLVPLAGEFQRIALSATARPLDVIADFVGGYRIEKLADTHTYRKRSVSVVTSTDQKQYSIQVRFPQQRYEQLRDSRLASGRDDSLSTRLTEGVDAVWPPLVEEFKKIIAKNTSTLVFTNSRRLAEKIAYLINEAESRQIAYSHHGSLSREVRNVVERSLKHGELEAIVATNSLELGIDIGTLDEVILVQTPFSVSSTLQRVGRSGHAVGRSSRGTIFPTHSMDFVAAAVVAQTAVQQEIEETHPVQCPLDVLSQIIVSMTAIQKWNLDELYASLRAGYAYHHLKRSQFDLVIDMLAGRYADSRIRQLRPRVYLDRIDNTIEARENASMLIYSSGGTIPDRGYFGLRVADSRAKLGELDEEFVWERSEGDTFILGTQAWRIQSIDYQNVNVTPASRRIGMTPFWKAEAANRDFVLSERIGLALEAWNGKLEDENLLLELQRRHHMDVESAARLVSFLVRQREATGKDLPHRHHVLVEHYRDPTGSHESKQVVMHTLWGGRINRPFSFALSEAWEQQYGTRLEVFADNDGILLLLSTELQTNTIVELVHPHNFESLLRQKLEGSGFFGARFRESAARALLLPIQRFKRMPLWLNRLRAKKLFEAVLHYPDFPILLETWRTCLQDEFDLANSIRLLTELQTGEIKVSEAFTKTPSPFSDGLVWRQTNKHMYAGDESPAAKASSLSDELIQEFIFSSQLHLRIPAPLIDRLQRKLQRTAAGYAPASWRDLLDWVGERIAIPFEEWEQLLGYIRRDHGLDPECMLQHIPERLWRIRLPGAEREVVVADEQRLSRIFSPKDGQSVSRMRLGGQRVLDKPVGGQSTQQTDAVKGEQASVISQWLRFYGPLDPQELSAVFGLSQQHAQGLIDSLVGDHLLLFEVLREDSDCREICDAENAEILLRMKRAEARPRIEPLEASYLPLFLAAYQGLTAPGDSVEALQACMERLFGYPAPAGLWEQEIIPARLSTYIPAWLDSIMSASEMTWFGCGKQKLSFAFRDDVELFISQRTLRADKATVLPETRGRFTFWDIKEHTGLSSAQLTKRLWELAWQGCVSNTSFEVVRKAIETKFAPEEQVVRSGRREARRGLDRWKSSRPFSGSWFAPHPIAAGGQTEPDLLQAEELKKDRVRQLLARYGVLFRELSEQELPELRWSKLFRTLRLMELSGEITSGHFFQGLQGVQFASHAALRVFQHLPLDDVYWMHAMDPASPCGRGLTPLMGAIPNRTMGTHLVYHGPRLVLVSKRNGRQIEIMAKPQHPRLHEFYALFKTMAGRQVRPLGSVRIETVNGEPAALSAYANSLLSFGFTKDYDRLILRGGY